MAGNEEYEIPETGAVFTFGRSRFADNISSHFFVRNDPVSEISCGDEHTALVCKSGRVFLFGKNDYGQLGFGNTKVVNKPSCLKFLKPFQSIHVACGKGHTIVSTACCRLFTFGCNSDGQLGIGDLLDRNIPQLVSTNLSDEDSIVMVAAGCHHSAFLTGKGELYLWGSNSDGQCGSNRSKQFLTPQKLEFTRSISTVSCGYYHSAFISDGCVYTFGEEDNGKLGRPPRSAHEGPIKVDISESCVSVKCGGNHTVVRTENGKAFAFGSNFSGQLGIGSSESEFSVPQIVKFSDENIKLIHVSCGESHSAFVTDQGILYTCGDARYGKLCNEDESTNLIQPTVSETFKNYFCVSVSCGGCHTMVVAKANSFRSDSTGSIKTILPPLRIDKCPTQIESVKNDIIGNSQDESSVSIDNQNDPEECDSKSNTESNLNEEVTSHADDIYADIKEIKLSEIESVASRKSEMKNENEIDVVVSPGESKIKKFLKRVKGKITSVKISTEERSEANEELAASARMKGHQSSRACSIL